MAGIYIHIPFCKSRCTYCAFYSTTLLELKERYIQALCNEIDTRCQNLLSSKKNTIYIGGGTPSQISLQELKTILSHLNYNEYNFSECTIECNPYDITSEYANGLASLGFNRVSLGLQTIHDIRLKELNRRHNAEKGFQAIKLLHQSGIHNISIDLIYGLPEQTLQEWNNDIDTILQAFHNQDTTFTHISAYCLSYEEGTPLWRKLQNNEIKTVDEETELSMYNTLRKKLKSIGFEHYEISNFALPTFRSQHNSSYWSGMPYIGIGAAAHSYDGYRERKWNVPNIQQYISSWGLHHGERICEEKVVQGETLNQSELYDELIMTRLRTIDGLPENLIPKTYLDYFRSMVKPFLQKGKMSLSNGIYRLTEDALFVSDDIIATLFAKN